MDDLDAGQPRCGSCVVVMRDQSGGWVCPACGEVLQADDVVLPWFDGPSIHGG